MQWLLLPLALATGLSACARAPRDDCEAPWSRDCPRWGARKTLDVAELVECSGVVRSTRYEGVYWVHNDSGDSARLFAVGEEGEFVAEVEVPDAVNVDWEDIAMDDAGHLYLFDVGNNQNMRRDLTVYVLEEPDPHLTKKAQLLRVLRVRYPEQTAFPDPSRNFDCEAAFWHRDKLYLLTKHRGDLDTCLYRLENLESEDEQELVLLDRFPVDSQVTGADVSPDGNELVVLCYEYLYLFDLRPGADAMLSEGKARRLLMEARQCECVAHTGENLMVMNEQREVHVIARAAMLEAGQRWVPGSPGRFVAVEGAPAALRRGYRPPRPSATLAGDTLVRLSLTPGRGEKLNPLPSASDSVRAIVRRDGDRLRLGLSWIAPPPGSGAIVGYVSWGEWDDRPHPGPRDHSWALLARGGRIEAVRPEAGHRATVEPVIELRRVGSRIEGWIILPGLDGDGTGAPGALNVILIAREGGDWSWGGDSAMFSWTNPFLWGHILSADG